MWHCLYLYRTGLYKQSCWFFSQASFRPLSHRADPFWRTLLAQRGIPQLIHAEQADDRSSPLTVLRQTCQSPLFGNRMKTFFICSHLIQRIWLFSAGLVGLDARQVSADTSLLISLLPIDVNGWHDWIRLPYKSIGGLIESAWIMDRRIRSVRSCERGHRVPVDRFLFPLELRFPSHKSIRMQNQSEPN